MIKDTGAAVGIRFTKFSNAIVIPILKSSGMLSAATLSAGTLSAVETKNFAASTRGMNLEVGEIPSMISRAWAASLVVRLFSSAALMPSAKAI
jgi:hypothetical protein